MVLVAGKLIACGVLALPVLLALWIVMTRWGRRGPGSAWTPGESLLAAMVAFAILVYLLVVGLGSLPVVARPLDAMLVVQGVLSLAAMVWCVRQRRELWAVVVDLAQRGFASRREATLPQRLVIVLGVGATLAMQVFGAWTTPWTYDTLTYHIPQMMQLVQDGRVGEVFANVAWADSYPRGGAILYAWGMLLVHTDAVIHATSGCFAWMLALATVAACRRLGVSRGWSLTLAWASATTPIVLYIGMSGYVDLIVGALIAAMVAFALPRAEARASGWAMSTQDATALLACFVLAMWCKIVPICLGGVVLAWVFGVRVLAWWWGRRAGGGRTPGVGVLGWIGLSTAACGLASIPYLMTWFKYGSPTYPMRLAVGPVVLFDGPLGPHQFGRSNTLSLWDRFVQMWGQFGEPLTTDSPGGFGPLFVLLGVAAMVVVLVGLLLPARDGARWRWPAITDPARVGWTLLAGVLLANLVAPEHHVTRYTIATLLVPAACLAWLGDRLRNAQPLAAMQAGLGLLILALAAWNVQRVVEPLPASVAWQKSMGVDLWGPARNRPIVTIVSRSNPHAPSPATIAKLRELAQPGELIVSAVVQNYFALYWDDAYSVRVEHHDADPRDPQMHMERQLGLAEEAGRAWLRDLPRDAAVVLVYRDAPEDKAIATDPAFTLAYEQSEKEGGQPVRIYRRK